MTVISSGSYKDYVVNWADISSSDTSGWTIHNYSRIQPEKFKFDDVEIPYISYELLNQAVNCTVEFVVVSKDKDDKLESYRIDITNLPNTGIKGDNVFALTSELAKNTELILQDETNHKILYVGYLKCEVLGILRYPIAYLLRIIE